MSRDKQTEIEQNEMAEIIAQNFRLNDEMYDASEFEWAAHCVQMAGYRKASEVAREIFAEIDDLLRQHYVDWDFCYYDDYLGEDFEKIKKKYTEEGK